MEQALTTYKTLRSGAYGESILFEDAAERIVFCVVNRQRCDEARAKRTEYERIYRFFWGESRDKLNKVFTEKCPVTVQ